jgi:hemerythrin
MEVGQAVIDADHRRLVDLINGVEAALVAESCTHRELKASLEALHGYTREHFEREESLMSSVRYADLPGHRVHHRALRRQLVELTAAFERVKAQDDVSQGDRGRLIHLLREWLLSHVLREDMLLKPIWARGS